MATHKLLNNECRKKTTRVEGGAPVIDRHSLDAFHRQLCELHGVDSTGPGLSREQAIAQQSEHVRALADRLGLLVRRDCTWEEIKNADPGLVHCSEHFVEFDERAGRWSKVTIPPKFGLTPAVVSSPKADLRSDSPQLSTRQQIEFVPGTPLDYLERCLCANEVFHDDVKLASVIEWADGTLSFGTTQPHYHGTPASHEQIEAFFLLNQWQRIADLSGHLIFFNYAFQVLAIDAVPRNCYIRGGMLQPFDVIVCRPNDEMEQFLGLYP